MNSLKEVMRRYIASDRDREQAASEMLFQMVAGGRYMQDIFTTYSPPTAGTPYNATDVVVHNDDDNGYWMVIDGKVFDVTEFLYLHVGGEKIIKNNAGIDATAAYQSVQHHVNSEVDALTGMYEIGSIRRLSFDERWGVAIGPDGLFYISVEEAFRTWVRYLYLITEMQNALRNDFAFAHKRTVRDEDPALFTPLKVQFIVETHRRFLLNYLDGLIAEDLDVVWSITNGLCEPNADIRWLRRSLEEIMNEESTKLARECHNIMKAILADLHGNEDTRMGLLKSLYVLVEREDLRVMQALKMKIREGVMAFEEHEADVIDVASEHLVAVIRTVPDILRTYYRNLADGMDELGITAGDIPELKGEEYLPEFTGHGAPIRLEQSRT